MDTGVGCHSLLQGTFLTQGSNLCLLQWHTDSSPLCHLGSHTNVMKCMLGLSLMSKGRFLPPCLLPALILMVSPRPTTIWLWSVSYLPPQTPLLTDTLVLSSLINNCRKMSQETLQEELASNIHYSFQTKSAPWFHWWRKQNPGKWSNLSNVAPSYRLQRQPASKPSHLMTSWVLNQACHSGSLLHPCTPALLSRADKIAINSSFRTA